MGEAGSCLALTTAPDSHWNSHLPPEGDIFTCAGTPAPMRNICLLLNSEFLARQSSAITNWSHLRIKGGVVGIQK